MMVRIETYLSKQFTRQYKRKHGVTPLGNIKRQTWDTRNYRV